MGLLLSEPLCLGDALGEGEEERVREGLPEPVAHTEEIRLWEKSPVPLAV